MKKLFISTVAVAATFALTACVSEDQNLAPNEAAKGYIALNVTNDDALTPRTVQTAPADWTVALGGQETKDVTVGTLASTSLSAGDYTVQVYNYADLAEALAANSNYGDAWYQGDLGITDETKKVTVTAGATSNATLNLGTAKNAKFTVESSVPTTATFTLTATGSGSRVLTFSKAANGTLDHTTAYFGANEVVTIAAVYNGQNLDSNKALSLTMGGAATENKVSITSNNNGTISLTIEYDDTFTTGNTQTITFDAATGETLSVTNNPANP